ncbi:hypothetical protein [Holospora curviuscula]|uniref:Uncharacterized protein n=1 Tax=Holospora curviuscula TaxID=1082868 RepID=A0A2S5R9I2_9PROT|nr:hypothetical protein [Holospora curviuscula]PPE03960.1 hypothetical protein HCUR_00495 [Holospora curviuscula]
MKKKIIKFLMLGVLLSIGGQLKAEENETNKHAQINFDSLVKESVQYIRGNFKDFLQNSQDDFNKKNKTFTSKLQMNYKKMSENDQKDFQEGLKQVHNFMETLFHAITPKVKKITLDGKTLLLKDKENFEFKDPENDIPHLKEIFKQFEEGIEHALNWRTLKKFWQEYKTNTIKDIKAEYKALSNYVEEQFKFRLGLRIQFLEALLEAIGIKKETTFNPDVPAAQRTIEEQKKIDFDSLVKKFTHYITFSFTEFLNFSQDKFNNKNKEMASALKVQYENVDQEYRKKLNDGLKRVHDFMEELFKSITPKIKFKNPDETTRELKDKGAFSLEDRQNDVPHLKKAFELFNTGINRILSAQKTEEKEEIIKNIQEQYRALSNYVEEQFKFRLGLQTEFVGKLLEEMGVKKEKNFTLAAPIFRKIKIIPKSLNQSQKDALFSTAIFGGPGENDH